MIDDDDADKFDDDPESPDASDVDPKREDDDSVDMEECPNCGKQIYDQAGYCPHCRDHVVVGQGTHRKPGWIIVVAIVLLVILLWKPLQSVFIMFRER